MQSSWFRDDAAAPVLPTGAAAALACQWEVLARKAGNVSPVAEFPDLSVTDFFLAAHTLVQGLTADAPLGARIHQLIQAGKPWVRGNANLGIALLLAPLAAAVGSPQGTAAERRGNWRARLREVLAATTVADAAAVYEAIRLAQPGGLGAAPDQDVAQAPTATLLECMKLATERDLIARQYANGFADIFELGIESLKQAASEVMTLEEGVIFCHLRFIAVLGDSLIERKCGRDVAAEAKKHARWVLETGWPATAEGQRNLAWFDRWLRQEGNRLNPGATADLVAATLFVALGSGSIPLPLHAPWASSRL